jgi:hypothetical protein
MAQDVKSRNWKMLSSIVEINWLAVLAATLASFVLGGIWFLLIAAKWYAAALGRDYSPDEKPGLIFIIGPLACTFITTVTSALFIETLNISSLGGAVLFGVIVGIGYHAATMTNIAINPNFPRPFMYSAVNAPFFLISSILVSIILTAMR